MFHCISLLPPPLQVAEHERTAQLAVLLSLAQPPASACAGTSGSTNSQRPQPQAIEQLEMQRLALSALVSCLSKPAAAGGGGGGASPLAPDALSQVYACAVTVLQRCCTGGSRVVESQAHSRYYAAVLRLLAALIVEVRLLNWLLLW